MKRVTWIIDLDAETDDEAARAALAIQRDPASRATVFYVEDVEEGDVEVEPGRLVDLDNTSDVMGGRGW